MRGVLSTATRRPTATSGAQHGSENLHDPSANTATLIVTAAHPSDTSSDKWSKLATFTNTSLQPDDASLPDCSLTSSQRLGGETQCSALRQAPGCFKDPIKHVGSAWCHLQVLEATLYTSLHNKVGTSAVRHLSKVVTVGESCS